MSFNLKKNYRHFGGTSVVAPELIRQDTTATDTLNVDMYDNFGLSKRRGEEAIAAPSSVGTVPARGVFTTAAGEKLVFRTGVVGSSIQRVVEDETYLDYDGSSGEITIEIAQVESGEGEKQLRVVNSSGTVVLTQTLGSPSTGVTLATVKTAVDASGLGLIFQGISDDTQNALGLPVIRYKTTGATGPTNLRFLHESLENISGINIGANGNQIYDAVERDGVVYFTTGTGLFKYDGTNYYPAGLFKPALGPSGVTIDIDTTASTSPAAGTYRYRVVYTYTDAQGNPIQSSPSDEVEIATTNANRIRVRPRSTTGVPTGVTGVTTIILRTKELGAGGGSVFFVVADNVALDSDFFDAVPDADLVEDFPLPPFELTASTQARYVDIWRNSLVLTGFPADPDLVLYEDIEYLEGFSLSNSFLTQSRQGGENSGIKSQDNSLFIFKEESITLVTGDLNTGQFQVDLLTEEGIGCVSNASIIESQGRIWFMSREGVYSVALDGLKEESGDLSPIFEKEFAAEDLRRTVALNNTLDGRLLFNVSQTPADQPSAASLEGNKTYCYNIQLGKWFIWDTVDFSGGISIKGRDIWFLGQFSTAGINSIALKRFSRTFTELDFADRGEPIIARYKSNWETLGEPSIPKKFVRMKIFSVDNERQRFESPDFTLRVQTEHDYVYGQTVSQNDLRFYDSVLETSVISRRTRLKPKKARSLRYILENSQFNKNMLISGVEFEVAYEHANVLRNE